MLRLSLLLLCLLPTLSPAATQDEDLAYSLGARLGERLRGEVPELPLDALLQGLRQAYQGEALRLPPERIEALLEAHEARIAVSREEQVRMAVSCSRAADASRWRAAG